jgi:Fic family protein
MNPDDFRNSSSGRIVQTQKGYWSFIPNPLPPAIRWSQQLVTLLSEADRAVGELAGLGRSLPNPHLLVRPFIHREAVLSSKIEGTQASLDDLYTYEAVQLSFIEQTSDVREIQNYVRALDYGLSQLGRLPISLRLFKEMHAILLGGVRGEEFSPGEFRRYQNYIGKPGSKIETAAYVPPPVAEMHQALSELEKFLHAQSDLPPLVRLGMVHYQFEAIHPFADGNGRIGRLLLILLLCVWGLLPQPILYLSPYFESHRQEYYETLLAVSRDGSWEDWLNYFLNGVVLQAHDAVLRIRRLQDLREVYRVRFQASRAAGRLLQVVDLLFERPILNVQQVRARLDVHFPAAQGYVEQLERAGILKEITGKARDRVYRADEIMRAIEDPFDVGHDG